MSIDRLKLKKLKIKELMPDSTILILGRRRSGKSSAKDTEILMFDGTIKKVQDIKVGEQVMGDDSTSRNVLETHSGIDTMYKVTNQKGESYTVNSHHILSLVYTAKKNIRDRLDRQAYSVLYFNKNRIIYESKNFSYKNKNKEQVLLEAQEYLDNIIDDRYIDIPIKDYMKLSKKYQANLLGYQVNPITFPEKELPIDPYMIGFWLGDGTAANSDITNQDSTILYYFAKNLPKYNLFLDLTNAKKYGYKISSGYGQKNNIFLNTLKKLNMINNKHIPYIYKCNSRENRLKLLAGFIDADGHLGKRNDFEITQCTKHEKLLDDIIYLARSLGFSCYKHIKKTHNGVKKHGEAIRININGKGIEEIPTLCPRKQAKPRAERVDALVSGITIEEQPKGEYYGIELDGNNRFVLGNFIVTHNSFLIRDIFYNKQDMPYGLVFSGTENANTFYGNFIPDIFIHSHYDPQLVSNVISHQEQKIFKEKKKQLALGYWPGKSDGKEADGKLYSNNLFIVLDDLMDEADIWKKDQTIKRIFFNGRHYNIFFILALQYAMGIPPNLRNNIDYIFIYNEPSIKNRRKVYEDYCSAVSTFDAFCNILDACTQNYECLVIKTSSKSSDLRDSIFWYKAKPHTNFRVGGANLWKYHNIKYNKEYREEYLADEEQAHNLQKKFANTRKLKMYVSKQGDYIRESVE